MKDGASVHISDCYIFSVSYWLAVTHSAKSHDVLLSDTTYFVSVLFRSRSGTPAAAWMNAPPPRHQLVNMWSPCIRTTG